jgi:hypothetical protein
MKRPRKPLPLHCYGLFYKVVRSLCYSRPRGFGSGRPPSYHLLLQLQNTPGITVTRVITLSRICYRRFNIAWEGMVKRYIKTVVDHLWKVITSNRRDYAMLPLFILAYWASMHDTTGFTPASLLFRRELQLASNLLFGTPPEKELPTMEHASYFVDHLCDIHCARQHLWLASNRMKTWYDKLANCASHQQRERVRLYCSTCTKRKSPKLQSSREGTQKVITRINDVVYRIQRNHKSRMMAVHLGWLVPYCGATQDEQP